MRIWPYLLFLFPLLISCSKLSVGVHWADTFAASQLDNYFDLDSSAKERAKGEFRAIFTEVRRQDFPRIASLLDGVALDVEKNQLTPARLLHWQAQAESDLKRAAQRFAPLAERLVEEQAPRGFAKFDEEAADKFAEKAEDLATSEDRLDQAKKRIKRVVAETLGKLTDAQMAQAEIVLKENPLHLEHEGRIHLFEQFKQARVSPVARKEFLRRYFFDWDSLQKKEYLQARDAYKKKSRELMLSMLASASADQKQHLIESFRSRAREFRDLAVK
jgi:hypothetical protein